MKEVNRPCVLCGESDSRIKHIFNFPLLPRPFELRECNGCGLLFNSPQMTDLAQLYGETYYVFQKAERTKYAQVFSQVKRHLDPNLGLPRKPLDILEVGSATGHLLHVLRHLNYRVQGVELSSSAAESARKRFGVDVFNGSIEEYVSKVGHGKMQHDVVWCNDVLEHVPDPVSFVKSCAMALKPAGRLILDTPNAGAQAVREGKPNWDGYNPYHIYLFGPENIELLLDKAGFRVQAKFSFRNDQSMSLVPRQPLRFFLRNTLKTVGLLGFLRRVRQWRSKSRDGELARQPMKAGEIVRRLEEIPWFSDSDDARAKLAEDYRGNNLVVHAVLA